MSCNSCTLALTDSNTPSPVCGITISRPKVDCVQACLRTNECADNIQNLLIKITIINHHINLLIKICFTLKLPYYLTTNENTLIGCFLSLFCYWFCFQLLERQPWISWQLREPITHRRIGKPMLSQITFLFLYYVSKRPITSQFNFSRQGKYYY